MKTLFRALCCSIVLCCVLSLAGFSGACQDIEEKVFRLHILANSDSAEDQQLKLKVRDEITRYTDSLFAGCSDKQNAMEKAAQYLPEIIQRAESIVRREGFAYSVDAYVTKMDFDTRAYEEFTLPAGKYDALRIVLGEGKGHNWWCVLYPAVCVPSAEKKIGSVLNENETEMVTDSDKYIIRFKIVELLEEFTSLLG